MQIGLLVGLAAFVPAALRLRLPASRLAYWHMLLAACLLLPAVRPWKQAVITLTTSRAHAHRRAPCPPTPAAGATLPATEIALVLLAAGMLVRLGWLATGFWRLGPPAPALAAAPPRLLRGAWRPSSASPTPSRAR